MFLIKADLIIITKKHYAQTLIRRLLNNIFSNNISDAVYSLKYGGGLRFRMGGHSRRIFLDLGVERHDNGTANYLTKGDIQDNPDGTVTLFPNRSDADLTTFRLGITIGG